MRVFAQAIVASTVLCLSASALAADATAAPQRPAPAQEKEIAALNGAFAAIDAKQYGAAEHDLSGLAQSSNPTTAAMAFQGLAHLYTRTRQFPKAVSAFESAIALQSKGARDIDIAALHRLAGQASVVAGQYDGAIDHLTKWQALAKPESSGARSPDAAVSLSYLAAAQAERHQFSAAQATLAEAVSMTPSPSSRLLALKSAIDSAARSAPFKTGSIAAVITPRN